MIQIMTVSKRFGTFYAVQNLSFEVRTGEVFGLLGENGAGKTTTLRMISTVLQPSSGTITVNGFDSGSDAASVRRQIGVVVGEAVYDRLTVTENLLFFGRTYGVETPTLKARIDLLLHKIQLEAYRDKLAGHLSRGNKQKLSLGRALLHDPPVLIMDEPMSGLDVGAQQAVRTIIQDLKTSGKTVIFSSHNMADVDRLCDRIAVIAQGRLSAYGALSDILEHRKVQDLENLIIRLQRGEEHVG